MDRGVIEGSVAIVSKAFGDFAVPKYIGAGVLTALAFLFDPLQKDAVIALSILVSFDFLTGIAAAYKTGEVIQSRKCFRTAIKYTIYMMLVSAGHLMETVIPLLPGQSAIVAILVITEMISILENAAKIGYSIPHKLLNKLKDMRDGETFFEKK